MIDELLNKQKIAEGLKARTEAKIRYAQVHLDEIKQADGSDFERSHQESFLFHLCGVRDAFLDEVAFHHGVVPRQGKTPGEIRDLLAPRKSETLATFFQLESDQSSWYARAKVLRDYGMHRGGVSRTFHVSLGSGAVTNRTTLADPRGGAAIPDRHYPHEFADWLEEMRSLVSRLRGAEIG